MNLLTPGKVNVVLDGQWGSTGKGKLFGYLNETEQIGMSICDFSPNAGHTFITRDGRTFVSKILPVGAWYGGEALIGPHAVFDPARLKEEVQSARANRGDPDWHPYVHEHACIVRPEDAELERASLNHIASTMQGSAAAKVRKIMRDPTAKNLAGNSGCCPNEWILTSGHYLAKVHAAIELGKVVLAETAQGFDLSLNWGNKWPYVTSRDCLVGRTLDNAGVSPKKLGKVVGSLRAHPIRVGNTPGGCSGPFYHDQYELSWAEVSEMAGMPVEERTTVTKRVRRIFTWSWVQFDNFMRMVEPDFLFLNFVNYLNPPGVRGMFVDSLANEARVVYNSKLVLLGTGAGLSDMEVYGG